MFRYWFFFLILSFVKSGFADDFAVVVGPGSPIMKLERQQVANIFLAKTTRAENGEKLKPIELIDSKLRSSFYSTVTSKSLAQVNSYWTVLIFTGKGKPPFAQENKDQIIQALNNDPNSIAYLAFNDIPENLRVVYKP